MDSQNLYNKIYLGYILIVGLFLVWVFVYAGSASFIALPGWFYLSLFFWVCFKILLPCLLVLGLVKSVWDIFHSRYLKTAISSAVIAFLIFFSWLLIIKSQESQCMGTGTTGRVAYDLSSLQCEVERECTNYPWYYVKGGCPGVDAENKSDLIKGGGVNVSKVHSQ